MKKKTRNPKALGRLEKFFSPQEKESELRKGAKFFLLFGVLFSLAYITLHYTPLKGFFGWIAAETAHFTLDAAGTHMQITILANGNYALESEKIVAELNEACSALIEIAVLFGIVFASFEKTLAYRAKGFAAGMLVLLVLNPVRIAASIIFIDPLVHDLLFRITLIIVIIGFYGIWHYGPPIKHGRARE